MARPTKPTKLKELNGSAAVNPGRINKNEPKPTDELGDAPDTFTDAEKQAWDDIVSTVISGVAFASDRIHIEMTARLLANVRNPALDDKGNPKMSVSAYAQLTSMLAKLGMNPADRSKINIKNGDETKDPWSDL